MDYLCKILSNQMMCPESRFFPPTQAHPAKKVKQFRFQSPRAPQSAVDYQVRVGTWYMIPLGRYFIYDSYSDTTTPSTSSTPSKWRKSRQSRNRRHTSKTSTSVYYKMQYIIRIYISVHCRNHIWSTYPGETQPLTAEPVNSGKEHTAVKRTARAQFPPKTAPRVSEIFRFRAKS